MAGNTTTTSSINATMSSLHHDTESHDGTFDTASLNGSSSMNLGSTIQQGGGNSGSNSCLNGLSPSPSLGSSLSTIDLIMQTVAVRQMVTSTSSEVISSSPWFLAITAQLLAQCTSVSQDLNTRKRIPSFASLPVQSLEEASVATAPSAEGEVEEDDDDDVYGDLEGRSAGLTPRQPALDDPPLIVPETPHHSLPACVLIFSSRSEAAPRSPHMMEPVAATPEPAPIVRLDDDDDRHQRHQQEQQHSSSPPQSQHSKNKQVSWASLETPPVLIVALSLFVRLAFFFSPPLTCITSQMAKSPTESEDAASNHQRRRHGSCHHLSSSSSSLLLSVADLTHSPQLRRLGVLQQGDRFGRDFVVAATQ